MPGSGLSLPLDLKHIASRCVGSYFAPKRFAAVQLAFATPRCRVLVFRKCPFALPLNHARLPTTSQCTPTDH
jgi:TATA-box binding protein (TBP) (component of TFIID and TFIIIB)